MSRTVPKHGRCRSLDTHHNDVPSSGDSAQAGHRIGGTFTRFAAGLLQSLSRLPGAPRPGFSGRRPKTLRIAFFSPPTAVCSLPSAWSALPSASFLSGCAAQSSAAGADHSYGTQTV
jgi:hypothetical protein